MGYIFKNYWIKLEKYMIYLSKIIGFIWKKIWDILGKNYYTYFWKKLI